MASGDVCKVVLVTGASSGFGQRIVSRLRADGHRVFGTSRRPQPSGDIPLLALDVTDDASVARCVSEVLAAAGRLDVLVNNAGYGLYGAVEDTSLDEARAQVETNFWGSVRMIRAALPVMRRQQHGRLITIGSLAGHVGLPFQPYYSASKFALEGLNEALRVELAGSGIDSTMVCPGDFRTAFTSARIFAAGARSAANGERLARALRIYERDELSGADPAEVADLVARLVTARELDVRYYAGRFSQRAGTHLKRWIPARWFEALLRSTYRL